MSQPSGAGILKWDADRVTPTTISVAYTFRANFDYIWAPVHLTYTTQVVQTYDVTDTVTSTRIGPFDGTPGDDEWMVETGETAVGDGSPPPFFRNTVVVCNNDGAWRKAVTLNLSYTYVGPGAPANSSSSATVYLDVGISFSKTALTKLSWANFSMVPDGTLAIYPEYLTSDEDGTFNPEVTVDPHTLKVGAAVNFGTTWAHTTADYLSSDPDYTVNSWDIYTSIQATAS